MGRLDELNETADVKAAFTSRAARLSFKFSISFHADGQIVVGESVDLSESGILVKFDEIIEAWIIGELIIQTEKDIFVIRARVARVDGSQAGLVFRPETEAEHEAVRMLIGSLSQAISS